MENWHEQKWADRTIVALDCSRERAYELAKILEGNAKWLKIGMTLFYQEGPKIVKEFKDMGFNIFVDLKLHDIPHQVEGATKSVIETGADMFTCHASGGPEMLKAIAQASAGKAISLGVTVLTSLSDEDLATMGYKNKSAEQVSLFAGLVKQAGLSGVVCSAQEAKMLREQLGPDAYIVTPGIRPANAEVGDQSRVTTPEMAFRGGSSHIVVGRPITAAEDPLQAFLDITKQD